MSEYVCREHRKSESSKHVKSELVSWVRCEEVIRCRDCKWFGPDRSDYEYGSSWWCDWWPNDRVNPEGYCAWAERREP